MNERYQKLHPTGEIESNKRVTTSPGLIRHTNVCDTSDANGLNKYLSSHIYAFI